jgi:hypothetical protein
MHEYVPFWRTNSSGLLGKLTELTSIFHVPSKTLCAAAPGTKRDASAMSKSSFFIADLLWFQTAMEAYARNQRLE